MKKNRLIQKSVEEVRKRAKDLFEVRHSPKRYKKVKSRITQNLKIQEQKSKAQRKIARDMQSSTSQNPNRSYNKSQNTQRMTSKAKQNPFEISHEEMYSIKKTTLNNKSQQKLQQRDDQIKQSQDELNDMLRDLKSGKSLQEKF